MATDVLLREVNGGLATLTLNRPDRMNALDATLSAALVSAFSELSEDPEVRVVRLRATGERAFCAGADMREPTAHQAPSLEHYLAGRAGVFDAMRRCRAVIVSEVNGWAVGGGLQLVLFSDLTFASAGAGFRLPQVGLGVVPPYATSSRLARQVGYGRAMQLLLLGEKLDAARALDIGLLQGVEPDAASLSARVDAVVTTLLGHDPATLRMAKNAMVQGLEMTSEAAAEADRFRDYALKHDRTHRQ